MQFTRSDADLDRATALVRDQIEHARKALAETAGPDKYDGSSVTVANVEHLEPLSGKNWVNFASLYVGEVRDYGDEKQPCLRGRYTALVNGIKYEGSLECRPSSGGRVRGNTESAWFAYTQHDSRVDDEGKRIPGEITDKARTMIGNAAEEWLTSLNLDQAALVARWVKFNEYSVLSQALSDARRALDDWKIGRALKGYGS